MMSKAGYVLDLTPTMEGDEVAALLGDLCLTKGEFVAAEDFHTAHIQGSC
jgi:hypothetical protein